MGDSWRENAWFLHNWGISEEKTRDFRLNVGFEKTRDFRLNGGFEKRKRDFCLNVVFAKRKRVIFAYMGDLQIEKAWFLG